MMQFLIKYYKYILTKEFIVIVFIPLFILLIRFSLPWWLTITGAVIIFVFLLMLTEGAGHLLQRITNNAIFTVCPRCGYANVKIVEICQNCDWQRGSIIAPPANTKDLSDEEKKEVDQNLKKGIYRTIPLPVSQNLSLIENEIILISVKKPSMRLHTITRDGDRILVNKFDGRCILNWLIITNKRVCFYAEMFGGWRLGFCHSYNDIQRVSTENKIMYSSFLDEVDRMTIETTDATYQLRGANPKKLYDAIKANIIKYSNIA